MKLTLDELKDMLKAGEISLKDFFSLKKGLDDVPTSDEEPAKPEPHKVPAFDVDRLSGVLEQAVERAASAGQGGAAQLADAMQDVKALLQALVEQSQSKEQPQRKVWKFTVERNSHGLITDITAK